MRSLVVTSLGLFLVLAPATGCGGGGGDAPPGDAEDGSVPVADGAWQDGDQADVPEDGGAPADAEEADGDEVDGVAPDAGSTDVAVDQGTLDASAPDADAGPGCDPERPAARGSMGAGFECLNCHGNFTAGGTLYDDAAGSNPVAGATVRIADGAGRVVELVTGLDGNFFTEEPLAPPLRVEASRCPDRQAMVSDATGACNGCHTAGNRIYLR